jgi:hypothetical protein
MNDTETCHFWVGQVPEEIASVYFQEKYAQDREITPLSDFARDQGEEWYDHDFLEYGWGIASSIQQLVEGYSYSDQWGEELASRVAEAGLTGVNLFVFINQDQIEWPRSVNSDGYWLKYMGLIEYDI